MTDLTGSHREPATIRTGPDLVAELARLADAVTADATRAATAAESAEAAVSELTQRLDARFTELSALFVPNLDDDTIAGSLKQGRSELLEIAERRDRRLRELELRRSRLEDELATRRIDWQAADAAAAEAGAAFDAKRAEIEAYLAADADYQAMLTAIDTARVRLERDEQRLAEVEADAVEKRPDYDADRLFVYLRDRRYGEPDYPHRGLFARWDRWVARLIDYPSLKASYRFLTDVPDLMRAEIERRKAELDDLVEQSLSAIRVAEERFELPPLKREADESAKRSERALQRLDRTREQLEDLSEQIDAIQRQEGGFYAQALDRYAAILKQSGDQVLAAAAAETATVVDDDAAADIRVLRGRLEEERRTAAERRREANDVRQLADDLEFVARRVGQSDVGTERASFPATFDLHRSVGQLQKRVIDRRRLLEVIKNAADIAPTWSERAYQSGSDAVNSPTAQILIGTAAQAALPVLREALKRRR